MTTPLQNQLTRHSITFVVILLFGYVTVLLDSQLAVSLDVVGGAILLSYILFGLRMMPSVILTLIVSTLIFEQQSVTSLESVLSIATESFAPALAIFILNFPQIPDISRMVSIDYRKLVAVIVVEAIFCAIFKLVTDIIIEGDIEQSDAVDQLFQLITLDSLGSLIVICSVICIIIYINKLTNKQE